MASTRFTIPLALALAVLVHDRPAVSQGCIDTSAYVSTVASVQLGRAHNIALNGTVAYVTGATAGENMGVVDVTNPYAPALVNTLSISNSMDVAVAGDFGYVTASGGLRVLDLSTPSMPVIVGSASGGLSDILVSGSYMYATVLSGLTTVRFTVLDISTPTSPQAMGTLIGTPFRGLALKGQYIYTAFFNGAGFLIIDVSNPLVPSVVGSFPSGPIVNCLFVAGNQLYLGGNAGLNIYDITDALSPLPLGFVSTSSRVSDVVVSGDNAYVLCDKGLRIVDVSDPTAPQVLEGADVPVGDGLALADNGFVYAACRLSGLYVVEASQPRPPRLGRLDTPGTANGVALLDGITVVADGTSGLQLVDSSAPDAPALVTSFALPGQAIAVTIAGRTAYVASDAAGLHILDLSSPTTPRLLGSYDTPGSAYGVQLAGVHAYVADVSQGLAILDVGDPTHPVLAGSVDTPGSALGVALSGSRVFVADGPAGLVEIDASNPSSPVVLHALTLPSSAWGLDVAGNYAYVATGFAGLQVVRINPLPFTLVSSQAFSGFARDVTVFGNTLYLSASEDGVRVFELSDPAHPASVGQIFAAVDAGRVAATGSRVYIADGYNGLTLAPAHCSDPTSVEAHVQSTAGPLLRVSPNPSSGRTSVLLDMPRASVVRLEVFDVAGRRVRGLLQGPRASGRHEFTWDGRSDAGLLQPAGVYMLRLESAGRTVARRIVRVR